MYSLTIVITILSSLIEISILQYLLTLDVHQKVVGTAKIGATIAFERVPLDTTTKERMDNSYTTALKDAMSCTQEMLLIVPFMILLLERMILRCSPRVAHIFCLVPQLIDTPGSQRIQS